MAERPSCSSVALTETEAALEFIQREIRCAVCDKLFTIMTFTIDRDFHREADVKVGVTTKCRGCKQMDNKLFVI